MSGAETRSAEVTAALTAALQAVAAGRGAGGGGGGGVVRTACVNQGNSTGTTVIPGFGGGRGIGTQKSSFYNMLRSVELNNGTIEELFRHGIYDIKKLIAFGEKALEKFAKTVSCNKSPEATGDVFFSAIVIFGLVITYAEFIPILISVRDLFR